MFSRSSKVKRMRSDLRAAIQKLPSPFREVLVLREFGELSYHEIAAVVGCPAGTVMSRLGRARAKLRDLLTVELDRPSQSRKVEMA
jgi:RNA polymerase sigma-70 factor, ECF subfamily